MALAAFLADEMEWREGGASSGRGVPALLPLISIELKLSFGCPLVCPLAPGNSRSDVLALEGRGRNMRSASGSTRRAIVCAVSPDDKGKEEWWIDATSQR